jgi:hypothetical protein
MRDLYILTYEKKIGSDGYELFGIEPFNTRDDCFGRVEEIRNINKGNAGLIFRNVFVMKCIVDFVNNIPV